MLPCLLSALTEMQIEELRGDMNAREAVIGEYERILEDISVLRNEVMRSGDSGLNMPVAMRRLVSNAQTKFDCGPMRKPALTEAFGPLDIVRKVEVGSWCEDMVVDYAGGAMPGQQSSCRGCCYLGASHS